VDNRHISSHYVCSENRMAVARRILCVSSWKGKLDGDTMEGGFRPNTYLQIPQPVLVFGLKARLRLRIWSDTSEGILP
jgi:hypothetical protein